MKLLKKDEKHEKNYNQDPNYLLFKVHIVKKNCDWSQKNLRENVRFLKKQVHEDFPLQKYLFTFIKICTIQGFEIGLKTRHL
jgi:hypothetical protein